MDVTPLPQGAGRRCLDELNSLHATIYFAPDLGEELAAHGVDDPMAVYLAGRAAPWGAVGAGPVAAAFNGLKYELIARHLPRLWTLVAPDAVVALRLRAADAVLRRYLGEAALGSPEMTEAAGLAVRALQACVPRGRPMYAAHADHPVPDAPHLALWHAATLLREYRGDGHVTALTTAGIVGLDALVSHSAGSDGLPKEFVMERHGWTAEDWAAAEGRLRARGLMDADGRLTPQGVLARERLEEETDRLDSAPYEHLGAAGVARLTELVGSFTATAAAAGAFPAELNVQSPDRA
ncbi:SCO6745 family protein [Streptomyces sp. SYSU K21746]